MTFQKNPKQKSSYPALMESFDKQRLKNFFQTKQKVKTDFKLRSNFIPIVRKVPNS